jgi:UPF0716 protein FxsA
MRFLLPFFLLLPIIEITLLIKVGQQVGVFATLGLLFFMGVLGMFLLRQQGFSTLLRVSERLQRGDMPAQEIVEGVVIAAGALFLVIPGFFTDFVALFCFLPLTRRWMVRRWLKNARVMGGVQGAGQFYHYRSPGDDVIEGEFQRESSVRIEKQTPPIE